MYAAAGALGALGGARPTGLGWLDALLLGLGAVAAAACARRARTVPVYLAAAAAALCQTATVPIALGCVALAAAFARRARPTNPYLGPVAGALGWAAAVGAPFEPGAVPIAVPLVAFAWVAASARQHGSRRFRRRFARVALAAAAVVVVGAGLGGVAVMGARADVDRGADLVKAGLVAGRAGDTQAALDHLRAGRAALAAGESTLGATWARPAWLVPGVSQNARALHDIVREVGELAEVAVTTAESADLAVLQARAGRVDVAAVRAVRAPLEAAHAQLVATDAVLDRAADGWLADPVARRLDALRAEVTEAIPSAELALAGAEVAPALLGGDGPRTYLVLFTTPVEARGRTGFFGNYAEVTFTDGTFDMTRFGRLRELDPLPGAAPRSLSGPDDYLARYGRFGVAEDWRNITMSPDFPSIAQVAAELYPQSGGRAVDGVLSVDPVALAALLRFTGPITVPGVPQPLDAESAAPFLLRDQYLTLTDNPERIDVLEALAETAFERLTEVDLPGPRELAKVLGPVVEEGHLQVMTFGDGEAGFLDRLGITGRLPAVAGDFLAVTTSNAAGNKIDLFLRRELDYDLTWDPATGRVSATVTLTLTNEAPASGLPSYVIGNALDRSPEEALPDGFNKTFVTIYTPWDHTGVTLDGEESGLERIDELGRRALSTFVAIGPGATRTLVVHLDGVLEGPHYRLDLAAQPQVIPEVATLRLAVGGDGPRRASDPLSIRDGVAVGSFPLVRTTTVTVAPR